MAQNEQAIDEILRKAQVPAKLTSNRDKFTKRVLKRLLVKYGPELYGGDRKSVV